MKHQETATYHLERWKTVWKREKRSWGSRNQHLLLGLLAEITGEQYEKKKKIGLQEQKTSLSLRCLRWEREISSIYWLLQVVVSCTTLYPCNINLSCFLPKMESFPLRTHPAWAFLWDLLDKLNHHWGHMTDSKFCDMNLFGSEISSAIDFEVLLLGAVWWVPYWYYFELYIGVHIKN